MRRLVLLILTLLLIATACTAGTELETTTTTVVSATSGVTTVSTDPDGMISSVDWLDPPTPVLERPIPDGKPPATLMASTQPSSLRVAVNGGGCLPEIGLTAGGTPVSFELGVVISEGIPEGDSQCSDVLTTYGLEVKLSEAVNIASATLTVTSIPPAPAP